MSVGSREKYRVFVDRRATMSDVEPVIFRIAVRPKLARRAGVNGPQIIGSGDVEDAVHQDWRGFDLLILSSLERPRQGDLVDVCWRDLRQSAVTLARIIAVKGGPAIGRGLEEHGGIDALRIRGGTGQDQLAKSIHEKRPHFRVCREEI